MTPAVGRLPVTLLTGFLGAGKTTVLNALLGDASSGRIAVIVNEFGEAGLDHELIETASDDIALMQSGCLCCSLRGELPATMNRLLARRAQGDLFFDRIVIETTGLADPAPIAQTLVADRSLARMIQLDGIVTVVDAVNGAATLDAQFEAVSQVAMADLILLSKTDLVFADQVRAIEARLATLNPGAKLRRAVHGDGVQGQIWGLNALRQDASPAKAISWTTVPTAPGDPLANLSGFVRPASITGPLSVHDARIVTASIVIDDPISGDVFDDWLDQLIARRGESILRAKGIVFLEDLPLPFAFHGVQKIFEPPIPLRNWSGEARRSRIVLIARDLGQGWLDACLQTLRQRVRYAAGHTI